MVGSGRWARPPGGKSLMPTFGPTGICCFGFLGRGYFLESATPAPTKRLSIATTKVYCYNATAFWPRGPNPT